MGYSAKGANLAQFGREFGGQMYVLSNLLTFAHLWNQVRVKGGAYGVGFRGNTAGDVMAASYRDPTPGKTLGQFDRCAQVVRELCAGEPDLTPYILGSMTDADPLLGAAGKIARAEARHFRGIEARQVQRWQDQLLRCKGEDLLALCPALDAIAEKNNYCVIAGKEQLDSCGALLDTIVENLNGQ